MNSSSFIGIIRQRFFRYSTIWLQCKHHSTSSLDCICTDKTQCYKASGYLSIDFVHGGAEIKKKLKSETHQDHKRKLRLLCSKRNALFNYGGQATPHRKLVMISNPPPPNN